MNTLKALIALVILILSASSAQAKDSPYSVTVVDANPKAGFNFSYILRIPEEPLDKHRRFLVVESNNSGVDDSYEHHLNSTLNHVEGSATGPYVASKLNVPLLVPVFPRTKSESLVYTHALDRDTLTIEEGPSHRLDIQLLNMVKDAQRRLKRSGVEVNDKFVLVGFSASGTFSNRFAFLHPEKLLAVVSGAVNSFPMLPISKMHGNKFNYPLGISDISRFTGASFNLVAWKSLPQMIFMGADDTNDTVKQDDSFSIREREIIFDCIGKDMRQRWLKSQEVYLEASPNVSFTTFGQVGHWTDGHINGAIVNFVDIAMRRAASVSEE